jgi:hypothetical protein
LGNSKWYYVNVERGNAADKLNGRNINVSFTNDSNVPIEVMVFMFYSDEIAIYVKTGLVTRNKNYFFFIILYNIIISFATT